LDGISLVRDEGFEWEKSISSVREQGGGSWKKRHSIILAIINRGKTSDMSGWNRD